MTRRAVSVLALSFALTGVAVAQSWPTRPITLVIPFAPGGGIDASARIQA
ncbi:MAG: tripartite tricarboxylate transporter substrate binding protein, partial [Bacillati bacterium ANGP1]